MKLPKFKQPVTQLPLWPIEITGHGHCRTIIGNFAENLTIHFLHGLRYRTDATADYCPDVFAHDAHFEVKAAGRTNQTFIYAGRLDRDRWFSTQYPLFYAIWHHGCDTKRASSVREVEMEFLHTLRSLYIIPFAEIDAIAATIPVTKLNSRYGGSDTNPRYGAGYRIPISRVRRSLHLEIKFERSTSLF
jgi:hypothetical protein